MLKEFNFFSHNCCNPTNTRIPAYPHATSLVTQLVFPSLSYLLTCIFFYYYYFFFSFFQTVQTPYLLLSSLLLLAPGAVGIIMVCIEHDGKKMWRIRKQGAIYGYHISFFLMCYFYVDYAKETKFALRRRLRIKNSNYT